MKTAISLPDDLFEASDNRGEILVGGRRWTTWLGSRIPTTGVGGSKRCVQPQPDRFDHRCEHYIQPPSCRTWRSDCASCSPLV